MRTYEGAFSLGLRPRPVPSVLLPDLSLEFCDPVPHDTEVHVTGGWNWPVGWRRGEGRGGGGEGGGGGGRGRVSLPKCGARLQQGDSNQTHPRECMCRG